MVAGLSWFGFRQSEDELALFLEENKPIREGYELVVYKDSPGTGCKLRTVIATLDPESSSGVDAGTGEQDPEELRRMQAQWARELENMRIDPKDPTAQAIRAALA